MWHVLHTYTHTHSAHSLTRPLPGTNLVLSSPPKEQRLAILNDVWSSVSAMDDAKAYTTVAEVYIEYPVKLLTARDVNVFLGDVLRVRIRALVLCLSVS